CLFLVFFFFFSSRRRHTSFSRDWSSDVYSSDLPPFLLLLQHLYCPARACRGVGVVCWCRVAAWGGMRLCDEGGRGRAGGSTVSMGRAAGAAGTVTTASTASTLPPREEGGMGFHVRSEEHTSELQSRENLV